MYTVYSIPNFILPLIGGLLIDKVGMRFSLLLFTFVLTFGQAVFTYGAYEGKSFGLLLAGRVIFSLSGENMSVGESAIISYWFKGKMLSAALAID